MHDTRYNHESSDPNMTVLVEVKEQWGEKRLYPRNNTAKLVAVLLRKKTIGTDDLTAIRNLGFIVKSVAPAI